MQVRAVQPRALFGGSKKQQQPKKKSSKQDTAPPGVQYGRDWYQQTREAAAPRRTVREEMEYRRQANLAANNGRERKDLYTDNWDGAEYKGSTFNILTILAAITILAPIAGLIFALQTYGVLWG